MTVYQMRYFKDIRGRVEPIRFMFAATGQPLEEELIEVSKWMSIKGNQPFGTLPVFHVDGKEICMTQPFARYIARKFGFAGENEWESALCDMFVDGYHDMLNAMLAVERAIFTGDKEKVKQVYEECKKSTLIPFMDRYEGFLKKNGGEFFVGKKVTWADFAVAEFIERMEDLFDKDVFKGHPLLKASKDRVYTMNGIKEYIAKRPHMWF